MTAYDPRERRDDVPEADRAEQERELNPEQDIRSDDVAAGWSHEQLTIDPFKANEADQLDQAVDVPADDEDYDRG